MSLDFHPRIAGGIATPEGEAVSAAAECGLRDRAWERDEASRVEDALLFRRAVSRWENEGGRGGLHPAAVPSHGHLAGASFYENL